MGHDMFISWILKIPSEARFPVWKVSLCFQEEVQGFGSALCSKTTHQITWLRWEMWIRNTFCAEQVFSLTWIPWRKLETEKVISQLKLKLPELLTYDFCPYQPEIHLCFVVQGKGRQKAVTQNNQPEDIQKIHKYELNLVFRWVLWRACLHLQREKQR